MSKRKMHFIDKITKKNYCWCRKQYDQCQYISNNNGNIKCKLKYFENATTETGIIERHPECLSMEKYRK